MYSQIKKEDNYIPISSIPSTSRKNINYTLSHDSYLNQLSCNCPAFTYKPSIKCKHITQYEEQIYIKPKIKRYVRIVYTLSSFTNNNKYTIVYNNGNYTCNCPSFAHKPKIQCHHIQYITYSIHSGSDSDSD